jgi:hypothetical protein
MSFAGDLSPGIVVHGAMLVLALLAVLEVAQAVVAYLSRRRETTQRPHDAKG